MPRTPSPGTHGRRARSDSDSVAVPLPPQTLAAATRPSPPATPRCYPLYRRMSAARGGTTTSRPPIEQWCAVSPNCCWAPRRLSLGGSLLLPRSLRGCAPAPPRGTWSLPSTCCSGCWPRRIGLWGGVRLPRPRSCVRTEGWLRGEVPHLHSQPAAPDPTAAVRENAPDSLIPGSIVSGAKTK